VAEFRVRPGLDETEATVSRRPRQQSVSWMRLGVAGGGLVAAAAAALAIAPQAMADPTYTPATPQLSTISGINAPWNEWQGDSAGSGLTNPFTLTGNGASLVNPAQVLPTYEPASGSTAYPNVALDQGATAVDSDTLDLPYQSGEVGTPGPLAGYCGSGDFNTETGLGQSSQPTVSTQPTGETLPLGPDYFPHVVLNADGSLTGYFDYRPKDENEAVLAATSTNGGKTWTYDQEALQQDPNYCASVDTNDDGQGHPNVLNFGGTTTAGDVTSGGTNDLFTLQRAAGDNEGVGMLVHNLTAAGATAGHPLGSLPSDQPTGADPDTFDADSTDVTVPTAAQVTGGSTPATLNVDSTGSVGSVNDLVAGGFVDLRASGTPSSGTAGASDVIQCTGVSPSSDPSDSSLGTPSAPASNTPGQLTGCEVATGSLAITVDPQDMLEQVIGYVSAQTPTSSNTGGITQNKATAGGSDATFPFSLPNGPNGGKGNGGYAQIDVSPNTTDAAVTSANTTDLGFTYELTGQTLNVNAPDRYYVDGTPVYCIQGNNNPTSEIENCTVPVGATSPSILVGDPILADPVVPAGASMTTGLISPDGIVGELHSFPTTNSSTVPSNATYVMYDEKKVNYYVAGELNKDSSGIAKISTTTPFTGATIPDPITFNPWEYISEDFGSQLTVSPSSSNGMNTGTFTLAGGNPINFTMGDSTSGDYDSIQCTGIETISDPQDPTGTSGSPASSNSGSLASGADDAFTGCTITADTPVTGATGGGVAGAHSFATNTMIAPPGAALAQPNQLQQTGEGKAAGASNAAKLYSNNEDLSVLEAAWTTDGVNFYSNGLQNGGVISGNDSSSVASQTGSTGTCASDTSYTDLSNPNTACSPENNDGTVNLNKYAGAGTQLATEERWPGSGGSIIYNPTTGEDELFLSGAWAGDGDSDAFNQVYYATSTNGLNWTVPKTVVSTDYSFSASEGQDAALKNGTDQPVGISAYYSGRAYGPAVVPNPNGAGFWMVFAGYNVPKGAGTAGDVLNTTPALAGTDAYVGSGQTTAAQWTIGNDPMQDDPAMYRNILVDDIDVASAPTLTFTAPTGAVYGGSAALSATSTSTEPITYSVDSTSGKGVCSVSGTTLTYTGVGSCVLDVNQPAGDGYADAASVTKTITVAQAPLTITASSATMTQGGTVPIITPSYSGFVNHDSSASLTTRPLCWTQAMSTSQPDTYSSICSAAADPNYSITYLTGLVTVTASGVIVPEATKTKLTASPATLTTKQKLRLSVDVTSTTATPRGTVKIYDGSKLLKTVTLSGAGKATATLSLKAGSYKLHAVYAGGADFKSSTSSTVEVKVKVKATKKHK
jgi:Bacterial Ig-like domain (group 3)/MBG domain (YGX type)